MFHGVRSRLAPNRALPTKSQSCRQTVHLDGAHAQERHQCGGQLHSQVDDELAPPHCGRGRGATLRGAGGGS
eukprot:10967808-Lingulodinium_polyedra.AAC.1